MSAIKTINKIKSYGIKAKKKYGQNFIFDQNIFFKIFQKSKIIENINILEIGPGPGGLTQEILKANVNQVYVVEKDKDLLPILNDIRNLYPNKLNIIFEDALNFDIKTLNDFPFKIISNLPYNISTVLLIKWLTSDICNTSCKSLTLMFQKEVAERIIATTNTKNYGRLAVLSSWRMNSEKIIDVSPKSFRPIPKVKSTILSINPKLEYFNFKNSKNLEHVTNVFFNQRRKMVKKPLSLLFKNINEISKKLGIDVNDRPQNLTPLKYIEICKEYEKLFF